MNNPNVERIFNQSLSAAGNHLKAADNLLVAMIQYPDLAKPDTIEAVRALIRCSALEAQVR